MGWALINLFCLKDGRLFEVNANLRLGAYSNKYGKCCLVFYEWPLNALLHKKLSLRSFRRKHCTIKDGAQTYDFIVDKSCLLFSIILKVVSG